MGFKSFKRMILAYRVDFTLGLNGDLIVDFFPKITSAGGWTFKEVGTYEISADIPRSGLFSNTVTITIHNPTANGKGLIHLDPQTGRGRLVLPYEGAIEDITWDNDGQLLYGVQDNQLWVYHSQTQTITENLCQLPQREIEALEMLPDNRLLFSIHRDPQLSIYALEIETCQIESVTLHFEEMKLNDVEGFAWPTCTSE